MIRVGNATKQKKSVGNDKDENTVCMKSSIIDLDTLAMNAKAKNNYTTPTMGIGYNRKYEKYKIHAACFIAETD